MSTQALEVIPAQKRELVLSPVMDLALAKSRMDQFQEFVKFYLEPSADGGADGGDYGPIPGAGKKKVLLKSGADKLTELYGLYDEYQIEALENFETKLFYYKITCILKNRRDDSTVGTGVGSCSTYESKYRWRQQDRTCPKCNNTTIIKGQEQYGGGWLCWAKKGGCGAKFGDTAKEIVEQVTGRIENPDIMDTVNTVLKMAKKRAKIDAVIGVTRSSGIFTQDLEDVPMPPVKPPVAVTSEDIPIEPLKKPDPRSESAMPRPLAPLDELVKTSGPAPANSGQGGETSSKGPTPPQGAEPYSMAGATAANPIPLSSKSSPVSEATPAMEYLSTGQQRNFHIECRKAVKESRKLDADRLTYQWLTDNGYINEKGEPTAAMIPAGGWLKERQKALIWLRVQ